jgi:uncharacterized protein
VRVKSFGRPWLTSTLNKRLTGDTNSYAASCVQMGLKSMTLALAMVSSQPSTVFAGPEAMTPNVDEIQQLLKANGTEELAAQLGPLAAQQVRLDLHRNNPSLAARADAVVTEIVVAYVRQAAERDHLVERLIPIYAKFLTKDDVRRITEFYRSPVGRKLVSVTPAISLESAKVGQEWMQSILPGLQAELLSRLRKENLIQ